MVFYKLMERDSSSSSDTAIITEQRHVQISFRIRKMAEERTGLRTAHRLGQEAAKHVREGLDLPSCLPGSSCTGLASVGGR
ncbi:rCG33326 [Rattus norvegicus]|uniref:RCG33326 n=1 Tax=Rattus norvegicus TaxID=10116 RepID=A6HHP6_RAT|nr:rCG33326 [Rattus norvegicus]